MTEKTGLNYLGQLSGEEQAGVFKRHKGFWDSLTQESYLEATGNSLRDIYEDLPKRNLGVDIGVHTCGIEIFDEALGRLI